jgi:hypothetical protein
MGAGRHLQHVDAEWDLCYPELEAAGLLGVTNPGGAVCTGTLVYDFFVTKCNKVEH